MPQTVVRPEGARQVQPEIAPPLGASAALEASKGIVPVKDTLSKSILLKSNAAVSVALQEALKSSLKLAKTLFGSVGPVFKVFSGLRRIVGGI